MAAKTWSGAGADNNWSTGGNWGGSAPVSGDTVTFNNTSVKNCTVDNLGTFAGAVTVAANYTGVITQSISVTFTVFSGSGGTWNCNGNTWTSTTFGITGITFNGSSASMATTSVTFSSGTLTATSATWTLNGGWTESGTPTFSANGGTISITANGVNFTDTRSTFNLITWNNTGSITFGAGTTIPLGSNPTTVSGAGGITLNGIIIFAGTWTQTGNITTANGSTVTGTGTPKITLNGNVTVNATTTITNPIGTITLTGSMAAVITDAGNALSGTTWTLGSGATKNVSIAVNTTMSLGTNPTTSLSGSILTVNGTLSWLGLATVDAKITTSSGSTVTASSTPSLKIVAGGGLTINATSAAWPSLLPITLASTGATLLTITDTGGFQTGIYTLSCTGSGGVTVAASTTMALDSNPTSSVGTGTITFQGTGTVSGAWVMTGSISVAATGKITGALTSVTFDTNFTVSSGGRFPVGVSLNVIGTVNNSTVNAPGISFGTSTATKGTPPNTLNLTIAANTTFPLGNNPTTSVSWTTILGSVTCSGTWTNSDDIILGVAGSIVGALTQVVINDGEWQVQGTSVFPASLNITQNETGAIQNLTTFFAGGGHSYGSWNRTGSGNTNIQFSGNNTFTSITDSGGVGHGLIFTAGSSTTSSAWLLTGSGGNMLSLTSTIPGSAFSFHSTGNYVLGAFLSIQDCTVDNGPLWFAGNGCILVSNTLNWIVLGMRIRRVSSRQGAVRVSTLPNLMGNYTTRFSARHSCARSSNDSIYS